MGVRLSQLYHRIRAEKGPFFMARLCLRVDFALDENIPDNSNTEHAVINACKELGYDPTSSANEVVRK